jgi:hypothetical protein
MSGKAKKEDVAEEKPSLPEVSREAKKALFVAYEEMATKVERLDAELKDARKVLGDHIKGICEKLGSNGPFTYKGKSLMASHKGDTWFFKSRKEESDVID